MELKDFDLSTLLNTNENYLSNSILNGIYWKFKVIVFCCIISFSWLFVLNRGYIYENFRSFYADAILHNPQQFFFWNSIIEQGKEPLQPKRFESGSHEANRTFRFTIPLISRVFRLNSLGLYFLQIVLGLITLYQLISVFFVIFEDKLLSFYLIFSFVNVYVGSCFVINCFGHGDAYTFFFILSALLTRNRFLFSVFVQMAFWCDERSVITALGFWFFQHLYFKLAKKDSINTLFLIATNIAVYIIIRIFLATNFHLVAEDVETLSFDRNIYFVKFISLWYGKRSYLGVEGFSLVILLTFILLYTEKQYMNLVIAVIYWIPIIVVSFLVGDTVRTLSFTFVFWIIGFILLKERLGVKQLKILILVVTFINFLIPTSFP